MARLGAGRPAKRRNQQRSRKPRVGSMIAGLSTLDGLPRACVRCCGRAAAPARPEAVLAMPPRTRTSCTATAQGTAATAVGAGGTPGRVQRRRRLEFEPPRFAALARPSVPDAVLLTAVLVGGATRQETAMRFAWPGCAVTRGAAPHLLYRIPGPCMTLPRVAVIASPRHCTSGWLRRPLGQLKALMTVGGIA